MGAAGGSRHGIAHRLHQGRSSCAGAASSREKEMAVRVALGAGPPRLMRQMLSESVVLAVLGGVAGALLAWWGTFALAGLGPQQLPRSHEVCIDQPVLLFTLSLSVLAGLLFGMAPA